MSAMIKPSIDAIEWQWKPFEALAADEVYEMLATRSTVFVIEQKCIYADIDGLDQHAWHLFAYHPEGAPPSGKVLVGYLRVLPPEGAQPDVRLGRVLTLPAFRGRGLGHALLNHALKYIAVQWPNRAIRLHAQAHLQSFYGAFRFKPISDIHDDDGIAHIWMRAT